VAALTEIREAPGLRIERDEDARAARATLRGQIDRLERRLGAITMDLWDARHREPPRRGGPARPSGARLLTLGELEAVRDALVADVRAAEQVLERSAESQVLARARLEAIVTAPGEHRFEVVTRAELGEPGCGAYHVLPRLGLLGMLFGWWCVKLSSGCP
jgi:hypothetical protein